MNAALASTSSRRNAAATPRAPLVAAPLEPGESVPISIAELVSHRPYLVRFALRKLRDRLGLKPGSSAHLLPRKVTRFSSEDIDPAAMI